MGNETVERQGVTSTLYNGTIIQEPDEIYHARSSTGKILSSHGLAYFRDCPRKYQKWIKGELPFEQTPALLLGQAAHCLILEGWDKFNSSFTCKSPINEKTGKPYGPTSQKYLDWVSTQEKKVITEDQWQLCLKMGEAVAHHPFVKSRALLKRENGVPEAVVRAKYEGVESQIRMDFLNTNNKMMIDLKTCGNLTYFEHDAKRFKYIHQMAFYRSVFEEATGDRLPVWFIAVEKIEPYRVGIWEIGQEALSLADLENREAIKQLEQFKKSNCENWPTGYENVRSFVSL